MRLRSILMLAVDRSVFGICQNDGYHASLYRTEICYHLSIRLSLCRDDLQFTLNLLKNLRYNKILSLNADLRFFT